MKEDSAKRDFAESKTLWFCCAMCAGHFDENRDAILSARKLSLST